MAQGQNEEAVTCFTQSIARSKEIGDQFNGTQTVIHLGQAYTVLGDREKARCLFVDAYANAHQNKWTLIILNILISYLEMGCDLPGENQLAIALSILSHPSVTPNVRMRSESICDKLKSSLSEYQIENAETIAGEKDPETWAREIIK